MRTIESLVTRLFLLLLPLSAGAQSFNEIADELCQKGRRGFIIFGDNKNVSDLVAQQPELEKFVIYKLSYNTEIGKRVGVDRPMMYAFNKNMVLMAKEELSSRGWKEMKKHLGFKLSKDCMMIVEEPEPVEPVFVSVEPTQSKKQEELERMMAEEKEEERELPEPQEEKEVIPLSQSSHFGGGEQRYWTVQIGAYGTEKRANDKIRKSDHVHMDMEVRRKWVEGKELYVVCAGRFVERRNAKEWAGRLNGFVYEIR